MALKRLRIVVAQNANVPLNEAAALINEGRVKINGETGRTTSVVGETDSVTLDGEEISAKIEYAYVMFHKPRGIECTMNEHIEANLLTVFDHPFRLYPVGRLDKESEGMLLMINDGKLYHHIAHADSKKEKEYYVEVHKSIDDDFLSAMRTGVKISDKTTAPCEVFPDVSNDKAFRIILRQGMNRQIRRMTYKLGYSVHRLLRTRIMHLELGELAPGKWRDLTDEELQPLLSLKSL